MDIDIVGFDEGICIVYVIYNEKIVCFVGVYN